MIGVDPIPATRITTNKPVVIIAFDPTDALVAEEDGSIAYVNFGELKVDAYWWSHAWDTDPVFEAKLAKLGILENPLATEENG